MRQKKRQIYYVDPSVQGALMLRFVGYWVLFLAVMFIMLTSIPVMLAVWFEFNERPTVPRILADTWSIFWPAMLATLLTLPAVLWDLTKMTNRFVGPVYRLRRSMRALVDGKEVDPVHFREGDFWYDFAEDFNRVVALARSTETSQVAREDKSTEFASKEEPPEEEPREELIEA